MSMNEVQTRKQLIDKKLRLAGWNVDDPSQVIQELDIDLTKTDALRIAERPTPYGGHRFADYGLMLNMKPAAVVEAKRTSEDAGLGKEQAFQYAQNLQTIHGGRLPFVFYTNGYDVYFWETEFYPPIKVHGFPSRDDLEWMAQRRETRRPLSAELIDTRIVDRDFQIAGIRTLLEGIEAKQRKFLLVMATGTGKTRVATALMDALLNARWAKRVLFLVDRIALRDQALDAFEEYLPAEPRWPSYALEPFSRDRRIYVTTYPTMLNLIQAGITPETWISPHFFDLVIADESHRSIYNIYTQVLDYFNAIKLGLTATPTDQIDHDTFELFGCQRYEPSFAYTYQEAISHDPPYLTDFEVLTVRSKFQIEGIKGPELSAPVQKKLIAEGKDLDVIDFEGTDLERKVTNSGTNALIVREFMEECIKDDSGTLPGKSIIFAISKGHARRLQEIFDRLYPEHAGKLARVMVSDDRFVYGKGGLLDRFKNEAFPRVAISVDMLDSGVDIREVVNLVFAKPVYSYVKFWQMIGRGTRVLEADEEKRKPWCSAKDTFLIIDCWGNFDYFDMEPRGREPGRQIPLPVRLFHARLDKLEAAREVGLEEVVASVVGDLRRDIAELPENNVIVADNQAELATAGNEEFWKRIDEEAVGFLRKSIAPVLRARSDADFKAMRFELEVVELGTALITGDRDTFEAIKESIINQAADLPLTVNVVLNQRDLIDSVQHPAWWLGPKEPHLCELAERLAPLMKYRQRRVAPMMKLDIQDLLAVKQWVEVGPEHERMTSAGYRQRVEAFVRALVAENTVLQKLQAGQEVTDEEIHELADLLERQDPFVTEELLRRVYDHKTAQFVQFMRHILGLEELESWSLTVHRSFDEFVADHTTLTSLQIQFLQTLRTFILQKGAIRRADLIELPFTRIHPNGVRGVFAPPEIDEIVAFAERLVA
jgi:type I restriction enzyme R subunit